MCPPACREVGLSASVEEEEQDWVITLSFADGREYDWRGSWVRGPTVAVSEPRTAAMVALGLVAMILIHPRRRRAARPL